MRVPYVRMSGVIDARPISTNHASADGMSLAAQCTLMRELKVKLSDRTWHRDICSNQLTAALQLAEGAWAL